ncbi:MAG: hypothetical protein JXA25_04365, partial [Anaerolineales bacterium]|nr:hypothetical protein [Anaerolineales bacterium]
MRSDAVIAADCGTRPCRGLSRKLVVSIASIIFWRVEKRFFAGPDNKRRGVVSPDFHDYSDSGAIVHPDYNVSIRVIS